MYGSLSDGSGTYTLSPSLSPGTYRIRADVFNLAGEEGYSTPVTFTIASATSSTLTDGTYSLDPLQGVPGRIVIAFFAKIKLYGF